LLAPGLFARLLLPGGGKHPAILLPDAAILFDQAESFVWVVDEKDVVQYRRIQVGRVYEGLRIIREGLKPEDRVIIAGTQRVGPGMQVLPEVVPISTGKPEPQGAGQAEPAPAKDTPPGGERKE